MEIENIYPKCEHKISLAKWLFSKLHILFLDEPTRGIDVVENMRYIQ